VLNSLKDKGAGFGGTTNKVKFINSNNEIVDHTLKSKTEVAQDLLTYIVSKINA
jgi:phosphopantothenoylcysteine decarboxylase/phosphopantothenate--cysteine ligase